MSEWKEYKLRDFGIVITGNTPSSKNPEDWGDEMLFITPSDYKNYHKYANCSDRKLSSIGFNRLNKKILSPNSLLVTCIGSDMGKVAKASDYCITNQQINSIIPNDKFDSDFIYYKLIDLYETLRIHGGDGTAVPIVNKTDFENIVAEVPENKEEQERIAGILSSLDDKIDLLHRQNATLEALAETLFRQYFIETNDTQNGKLGDYIIETIGGDWGKENKEDEFCKAVQCIRGTDIADLNIGIALRTPVRFVKEAKFEKIEPHNGDLILEISGGTENQSTGRVTYINDDIKSLFDYPLVFSNFCRMLRIKDVEYSYFLYCYIKHLYSQDEFFNLENGSSGIKNFDYKALLFDLEYPMPQKWQIIIDFDALVKPLFEKINKNKQQIRILTKLRDTLLPKLMNNEMKIY